MNTEYLYLLVIIILILYIYTKENNNNNDNDNKEINIVVEKEEHRHHPLRRSIIDKRDHAVLNNPLYPPYDRYTRPFADDFLDYKRAGIFNYATRSTPDTYRLMGYIVNSNDKNDVWNIFGRQKYRGSSHGEFYVIKQCNNNVCTKIELTKDILNNQQINDFYNLPSTLTFTSPMFDVHPYNVVQLNMSDGQSPYI